MNLSNNILILIFLLASLQVMGQDSIPLPTQNVKVVKQFQPRATEAKAIEIFPQDVKEKALPAINMQYEIPAKEFEINYPDPVIKPLVYEENKEIVDNKDGYVKLGYGNLNSPFLESQIHYDIQDWFQTGINLKHFSAKDESPEIFRGYSRTDAEIYASYYLTDQTKVTADVFYENQDRTLCCTQIEEFDMLPSTMLDHYGVGIRLDHNSFSVKGFSTKHNIGISRINSRLNEESEFKYGYSSTSNKTINKKLLFNLPLSFDYFTSEEWNENPYQFTTRPNVFYKDKNLSIRGGAFIASADTMYVRPHLEASYQLTVFNIELQASYVANSSFNSLHKNYQEMPFYRHGLDSLTSMSSFEKHDKISIGALYKTKKSAIYLGGFYSNYRDKPMYVFTTPSFHESLAVDYDGFGLEIKGHYALPKILSVHVDLELNNYSWNLLEDVVMRPTYSPGFKVDLKLVQEPVKGLLIYERMEFQNEFSALRKQDNFRQVGSMDRFLDLSAGIEYVFKNKIGLYIEAGNLLNKSYQRYWLNDSFGINFQGGIKFLL